MLLPLCRRGMEKSLVFQVCVKAINCRKVSQAMEANTVVLVICPLTNIIEDQVKEGESSGLKCVTLDMNLWMVTIVINIRLCLHQLITF